jgi:YspA, cpYpsA-related SLOG family
MKISLPAHIHKIGALMVLVTGGRKFNNELLLFDALDQVETMVDAAGLEMIVLQGGAIGADRLARQWAWHNEREYITEPARWTEHGKSAGPRRNQLMIDKHHPDICIAMPGGAGTADMVQRCHAAGIPIYTQGEDDEQPGR